MNEFEKGKWFRGNAETFSLGNTINFKTDFLQAARNMAAPEVDRLVIRFTGTVNSSAGTAASGSDAPKLISRFKFTDREPVIDASGHNLRLNEILELGPRQVDMTDLAAGAADATRTWQIVIPFGLPKAERSRDTRVPLEHFLDGGQLELQCASALPTGWDGFTGTVRICAYVIDGRRRELKSRLTLREVSMPLQEDNYQVNGSVRYLVGTSTLTTTGASSWASNTAFDSQTLGWPAGIESDLLVEDYRMSNEAFNTNDPFIAATPLAVPFVTPSGYQKTGAMPDMRSFHLSLNAAAPTSARLLMSVIKDRNPELAALVAGYASVSDYAANFAAHGEIVSAKGKNAPVTTMRPDLVRRLPARIGGAVIP
jgi:hypothetical protein